MVYLVASGPKCLRYSDLTSEKQYDRQHGPQAKRLCRASAPVSLARVGERRGERCPEPPGPDEGADLGVPVAETGLDFKASSQGQPAPLYGVLLTGFCESN